VVIFYQGENMHEKDIDALIKLQGTVEGPRSDEEFAAYWEEREAEFFDERKPIWLLINHDPELDGRVWVYNAHDRLDEVMQVRTTEHSELFEASKGVHGELGSGLVSLSAAVEFVENK
jgi:hypothetical protein